MEPEGTVSEVTVDTTPAPVVDTGVVTPVAPEQTPDYGRLIDDLDKNWDKIPAEMRQRVDRHFQPAFNRNLNLLHDNVNRGLANAGIQIPDGKTPLDLITENDGRGFTEAMRAIVAAEIGPVRDKIGQAEQSQTLNSAITSAVQANPDIKPYVEESIAEIDQNADLTKMAMMGGGKGLFYVLQGVAERRGRLAAEAKNRELAQILDQHKIVLKTGGGTSKAGAGAPKQQATPKAKTLQEATAFALEQFKAEMDS